jgi:hypothetical protein
MVTPIIGTGHVGAPGAAAPARRRGRLARVDENQAVRPPGGPPATHVEASGAHTMPRVPRVSVKVVFPDSPNEAGGVPSNLIETLEGV